MKLNNSQLLAEKEIIQFLAQENEQCLLVQAPSGYGKTYLINAIKRDREKHIQRAKVLGGYFPLGVFNFTAPTNKAASLGFGGTTVHKLLKLRPVFDDKTGKSELIQTQAVKHEVGIIDEYSVVDKQLLKFILLSFKKIIFLGDKYQLAPVKEKVSPVTLLNILQVTLTEPMRQHKDSDLFKLCCHLRNMVQSKTIVPFTLSNDCQLLSDADMSGMLNTHFGSIGKNKMITFTNKKAITINKHMRKLAGKSDYWCVGEHVVPKSSSLSLCGAFSIIEEEGTITDVDEPHEQVAIDGVWYNVPKKYNHVLNKIKQLKRDKEFREANELKEMYLDLRANYAGTCHSAQGSSYDNVFIDLSDFNACYDIGMFTQLMYVAVSRAKHKVFFYGQSKYNLFK